jgi:hypothetical protein
LRLASLTAVAFSLQKHQDCCYAADDDATFELRVKTVSYFKGIEKTSKDVFGDGIHGRGSKRRKQTA